MVKAYDALSIHFVSFMDTNLGFKMNSGEFGLVFLNITLLLLPMGPIPPVVTQVFV